jgi:hypothetical protein
MDEKRDKPKPAEQKDAKPGDRRDDDDKIDEASEESFPASDPPSWSPTHVGRPGKRQDD